jgi:hypothetical protein
MRQEIKSWMYTAAHACKTLDRDMQDRLGRQADIADLAVVIARAYYQENDSNED